MLTVKLYIVPFTAEYLVFINNKEKVVSHNVLRVLIAAALLAITQYSPARAEETSELVTTVSDGDRQADLELMDQISALWNKQATGAITCNLGGDIENSICLEHIAVLATTLDATRDDIIDAYEKLNAAGTKDQKKADVITGLDSLRELAKGYLAYLERYRALASGAAPQ